MLIQVTGKRTKQHIFCNRDFPLLHLADGNVKYSTTTSVFKNFLFLGRFDSQALAVHEQLGAVRTLFDHYFFGA
jgi:hypothetical protein